MLKIRTLIVDDMPLSRERTRRYLAHEADIEIIGECGDGQAALAAIERTEPDLVLLDVQMPELNGLAMLSKLPPQRRPAVVFITAFEEFAVAAFEIRALDYLLKPFDQERLSRALDSVRAYLATRQLPAAPAAERPAAADTSPEHPGRIAIKSGGKTVFVQADAIDWVESAGNYLCLHAGGETHIVRKTMGEFETQLDPVKFVRIHRSTLVRIEAIREMQPLFNGERIVILRDGTELALSRSYRDKALAALGAQ